VILFLYEGLNRNLLQKKSVGFNKLIPYMMKKAFLFSVSIFVSLCIINAQDKKPSIKNKYVLQVNAETGEVEKTDAIDSLVWLKNGYAAVRVVYKEGGFDSKLAKTEPLSSTRYYPEIHNGQAAWGIIEPSGKWLLEPLYYSIDLWSNLKGIAYKYQKSKRGGSGYWFSTYVNVNTNKVKYLGDAIDIATMVGTDAILMKTMSSDEAYNGRVGLYDSNLRPVIDTIKGSISVGKGAEVYGFEWDIPSLANINNTSNPEYIFHENDQNDTYTVYDMKMHVLIPDGRYDGISEYDGYLKAKLHGSFRYVLLDDKLKVRTDDYKDISWNTNGYFIFESNPGDFTFTNKDLVSLNPDTVRVLNDKYNAWYEAEKAKERAKEVKNATPAKPVYAGSYGNFELTVGYDTYKSSGTKAVEYFTINEVSNDHVVLAFHQVSYKDGIVSDGYRHIWKGKIDLVVTYGTIPGKGFGVGAKDELGYFFNDPSLIETDDPVKSISGYFKVISNELFFTGVLADGTNFSFKAKRNY
jgi:hypothetical protein